MGKTLLRMRDHRPPLSAVLTLLVALVTTGATFVTSRPHDGSRRRNAPVRVVRGGVQRPDSPEAISHDAAHHDPVTAPTAEGLMPRLDARADSTATSGPGDIASIHAFPPGVIDRAFDASGDAHSGAAVISTDLVLARSTAIRPASGRAPPAL